MKCGVGRSRRDHQIERTTYGVLFRRVPMVGSGGRPVVGFAGFESQGPEVIFCTSHGVLFRHVPMASAGGRPVVGFAGFESQGPGVNFRISYVARGAFPL